jgi:hypothetical protein
MPPNTKGGAFVHDPKVGYYALAFWIPADHGRWQMRRRLRLKSDFDFGMLTVKE